MKFLVESEFQGQGPPRTQETTKTTSTIRIPRVGFGTDRPYIALFWADLPHPTRCLREISNSETLLFSDDFQPVLAMKFIVESEFQGQGPPRTQETTKTTGTIRIPRVGFGTDRPYIALFWSPVLRIL